METRNLLVALMFLLSFFSCVQKEEITEPLHGENDQKSVLGKVLYVDSYHADFPWIQDITAGMLQVFGIEENEDGTLNQSQGLVELKIHHMDTKRHQGPDFMQKAVQDALSIIEVWQPDVVITSDDNAAKYLIEPYFKGSELPFVFCGVNWDASVYGFPQENITGILEVQMIDQLVNELSSYAKGNRVGFIKGDSLTAVKEGENFESLLGYPIVKSYARDYADWKEKYIALQKQVDILLVGHLEALPDWDQDFESLSSFMLQNTEIPTGSWDPWFSEMVLITYAQIGREQGEWAAEAALKILQGTSPSRIPISRNKNAAIYLNMKLARKLNIKFPMELVERSHLAGMDNSL